MRLKENFALRQIAQRWVVLPLAEETEKFSGMLALNDSGAMLWKVLEENCSVDAMVEALMSEYKISEKEARNDAEEFLNKLINKGCIEEL